MPNDNSSNGNGWRSNPLCIGFSEIDKYAIQVYKKHFNHKEYGDITKLDPTTLPDFDLLCGGFPCQAFSIAGKRGGFEDTRGTLIYDVMRIAKAKEPMYMLLENVKGLVSHNGGQTLEVILESIQSLGYFTNWEIRNAKDYGVPQNRERIFFLCKHIKLLSSVGQNQKMTSSETIIQEWLFQVLLNNLKEVEKLQGQGSKDSVLGYVLWKEISRNLELSEENTEVSILTEMEEKLSKEGWQNIEQWLKSELGENWKDTKSSTISTAIKQIIEKKTYTYSEMLKAILFATVLLRNSSENLWNEVLSSLTIIKENTKYARINNENKEAIITESGTLHFRSQLQDNGKYFSLGHLGGFGGRQVFPIGDTNETYTKQSKKLPEQVSNTLRTNYSSGYSNETYILGREESYAIDSNYYKGTNTLDDSRRQMVLDGRIRRLTPVEAERLMGLPDGWTEGVSDTQRYKLCGNGVVVNVVKEIIKRLI